MKIEWKAIRKRIDLAEYAEELRGGYIDVQVNVSRELRLRMLNVSAETPEEEFLGLLGELWNGTDAGSPSGAAGAGPRQGTEAAWPMEDIQALREQCVENDPQLWKWVVMRTWELVLEYQGLAKKK